MVGLRIPCGRKPKRERRLISWSSLICVPFLERTGIVTGYWLSCRGEESVTFILQPRDLDDGSDPRARDRRPNVDREALPTALAEGIESCGPCTGHRPSNRAPRSR
jgi:hypothetical protein